MATGVRLLRTVVAFVATFVLGLFVFFELAIVVVPNRTADGHGLMPIGQAGFALIASLAVAALVARRAARSNG